MLDIARMASGHECKSNFRQGGQAPRHEQSDWRIQATRFA